MKLGGFSLLGILVALVIVALLMVHVLSKQTASNNNQGPVGIYRNASTSAEQSAAQQNGAAGTASQLQAP